jgi:hypothetical protein
VATGFPKRSCSNKKIERDDDSKKSHPALERKRCNPADVCETSNWVKAAVLPLPWQAIVAFTNFEPERPWGRGFKPVRAHHEAFWQSGASLRELPVSGGQADRHDVTD